MSKKLVITAEYDDHLYTSFVDDAGFTSVQMAVLTAALGALQRMGGPALTVSLENIP
jgi:hypothetical protein